MIEWNIVWRTEVQKELNTGEQEVIQENHGEVQDPAPCSTDCTMVDPVPHEPVRFNWAADVNVSIGLNPVTCDDPVPVTLEDPAPIAVVEMVINTAHTASAKPSPIMPVSSTPSIMHRLCDFSVLCSGTQNPWGSLNHRHCRPYLHTRHSNLLLEPQEHSHSHPLHSHNSDSPHPYSQSHPYSHLRHVKPHQLNVHPQLHLPVVPQPSINIFQIIQHPIGISDTKPKIIKNIPASLMLPADTQEDFHISRCVYHTFLPVHGPDQGNWRLRDLRWRFRRGFHRRFWEWEHRRSHLEGGGWSRDFCPS
jgi:hypothetical protein